MNASEIKEQAGVHYHAFTVAFQDVSTPDWPEAVHQYRVSLKRFFALRSYLLSTGSTEGGEALRQLVKRVRPVYKIGGDLRDLQIVMSVPASVGLVFPPSLYRRIYRQYKKMLRRFNRVVRTNSLLPEDAFIEQFANWVDRYYEGDIDTLILFLKQNRWSASQLLSRQPGKEWHSARRYVKQNFLLMQMANTYYPAIFSEESLQKHRDLEQSLGRWHDALNLLEMADQLGFRKIRKSRSLFFSQLKNKVEVKEGEIRMMLQDPSASNPFLGH